jgi:hypothetical protein
MLKRNTYYPPNQLRVQRRRCHIHYTQNVSPSMLNFHEVVLVVLVSTTFPITKIENQLQVFMSGISM